MSARVPLERIDLDGVVLARNDVHPDGDWWLDLSTGDVLYLGADDDEDRDALARGAHVLVPTAPQPATDVDDFFLAHGDDLDDDTAARLYQAFRRKGGFRRFRELVVDSPAAPAWAAFTRTRETARAVAWLGERGVLADGPAPDWHSAEPN